MGVYSGPVVSNPCFMGNESLILLRSPKLCFLLYRHHIQMYAHGKGIPKSRAVTPPCNLWVHTTTCKERTDDKILISKPLPGESTHERKSNRRTYLQEARRKYCRKLEGYKGRRGISHQRQCKKWEKLTTVSISELGENYLGRLRRPSWVMGLLGQCGWKKGLRGGTLLSMHHALLLTLADLTRGELLCQGHHLLLCFFCVQTQRRKGHWRLWEYRDSPEILGLSVSLTMDLGPMPGKGESIWIVCESTNCHISQLP